MNSDFSQIHRMGNVQAAGTAPSPGMSVPPPPTVPGMGGAPPPPAQGTPAPSDATPDMSKVEEAGPGTFEDLHKKCKGEKVCGV